jgi:hypothetical protein
LPPRYPCHWLHDHGCRIHARHRSKRLSSHTKCQPRNSPRLNSDAESAVFLPAWLRRNAASDFLLYEYDNPFGHRLDVEHLEYQWRRDRVRNVGYESKRGNAGEYGEILSQRITVDDFYVGSVSPAIPEEWCQPIIFFHKNETANLAHEVLRQFSVPWTYFDDGVVRTRIERLYNFSTEIGVDKEILTERPLS